MSQKRNFTQNQNGPLACILQQLPEHGFDFPNAAKLTAGRQQRYPTALARRSIRMLPLSNFIRRGDDECDVSLKGRGGGEFKAHWMVLIDHSKYFEAMQRSGMKEVTTGCVEVDADDNVVQVALAAIYGERLSIKLNNDMILQVNSLLRYWGVRGMDVLPLWDKILTAEPAKVLELYGLAVPRLNREMAHRIGLDMKERRDKGEKINDKDVDNACREADDVGMWAIKLLQAVLYPPADAIGLRVSNICNASKRKETMSHLREKLERQGNAMTGQAAERLMRLVKGEEVLDAKMIPVAEFKEHFDLVYSLDLSTEWLEEYACGYPCGIPLTSYSLCTGLVNSEQINKLFNFSAKYPNSSLGPTLLLRKYKSLMRFSESNPVGLAINVALNILNVLN